MSQSEAIFWAGPAIGVFGGLCAVVAGALFNAHLNRKRDDRLRRLEARMVALALREELKIVCEALREGTDTLQSPDGCDCFVPDPTNMIRIYPHLVEKLGLLSAEAIQKVSNSYGLIGEYGWRLTLLGAERQDGTLTTYLLRSSSRATASTISDVLRKSLDDTIAELSKQIDDEARRPQPATSVQKGATR